MNKNSNSLKALNEDNLEKVAGGTATEIMPYTSSERSDVKFYRVCNCCNKRAEPGTGYCKACNEKRLDKQILRRK